jgi:DNA-binding PadR family transcriptional regulator
MTVVSLRCHLWQHSPLTSPAVDRTTIKPLRTTLQLRIVLQGLIDADGPTYGLALVGESGLAPETLYRCLHRLRDAGWTTEVQGVEPEAFPPSRHAPRNYYELTPEGREAAKAMVKDLGRVSITSRAPGGIEL